MVFIVLLLSVLLGQLRQVVSLPVEDNHLPTSPRLEKRAGPRWDWDTNLPNGDKRDRVVEAWSGMLDMAEDAYDATGKDYFEEVINRYFDGANEAFGIYGVLQKIVGTDGGGLGGPALDNVLVSNRQIDGDQCANPNTLAYAANIELDGKPGCFIKLCDKAYDFPLASEIQCGDLDDEVSAKMSLLAGIFLHELTHCDEIGKAIVQEQIVDHGAQGYGPLNVVRNGKGNVFRSLINADSYRWMATEFFWRAQCNKGFREATDNADFKKCPDAEEGICVIQ